MATPGTKIIKGKYISAWGGIQSAGQVVGQVVSFERCFCVESLLTVLSGSSVHDGSIWQKDRLVYHLDHVRSGESCCVPSGVRNILTDCFQSVMAESFATTWQHWLVAKLLSGMGVGMLQSTLPMYLTEIAPSQLRGFFVNAYSL